MVSLAAWAAPARDTRDDDTARSIADAPTTFNRKRGNAEIVGRVLTPDGLPNAAQSGQGSRDDANGARILFPAGTDIARDDLLAVAGGASYRVFFVYPNQRDRVLVGAEVRSR